MTDLPEQPAPESGHSHVDAVARTASRGLHAHVASRVDPEILLATLPATNRPRPRSRFLAVAAIAALLVGSAVILEDQDGDRRSRLELDEDGNPLPVPQPGTLTPLGPRDGKDSVGLPVTVEPNEGLADGVSVVATGSGFEPGEQVGIVQCAREAGAEDPEARGGGVDGCDVSSVVYADAGSDGLAAGRITVRRVLTTPLTGTVDCAAEAQRCLIGMGAIADYDRSGGFGLTFVGGGEPVDIPTLSVEPADGLHDGDVVRVRAEGYRAHEVANVAVCSTDPSACWETGGSSQSFGVEIDGEGRVDAEVTVYRFLPGLEPGTYIDCAISPCWLRVQGPTAAPPVRLGFVADGVAPIPPAVAVDPSDGLAPGDKVVVRGAGFEPGDTVYISLCAGPVGAVFEQQVCFEGQEASIEGDGSFAVEYEIRPQGMYYEDVATTIACATPEGCGTPTEESVEVSCDGVRNECAIFVQAANQAMRPTFAPTPVPVTFRPR